MEKGEKWIELCTQKYCRFKYDYFINSCQLTKTRKVELAVIGI